MPIQNRADLNTQADTLIPTNTSQQVSPSDVKTPIKDNVDSSWNKLDEPQIDAGEIAAATETAVRMTSPADLLSFIQTHGGARPINLVGIVSDDLDADLANSTIIYTHGATGTLNLVQGMPAGVNFMILNATIYDLDLVGDVVAPTALFRDGNNLRLGPGEACFLVHSGSDTYDYVIFGKNLTQGAAIPRYQGSGGGWANITAPDPDHEVYSTVGTVPAPSISSDTLIVPLIERVSSDEKIAVVHVSGDEATGKLLTGHKGIFHNTGGKDYLAAQISFFDVRQRMVIAWFSWDGSAWSYFNLGGDFGSVTFVTNTVSAIVVDVVSDGSGDLFPTFVQETTGDPDIYVLANQSISGNQINLAIKDRATRANASTIAVGTRIFIERRFHGPCSSQAQLDANNIPGFTGSLENVWASGKLIREPH